MVALTLQQRNLLHLLLTADAPLAMAQLAEQTNLSSRQVNYRLKPVRAWLAQRDIALKATPGLGVTLECSPRQRQHLLHELDAKSDFHLVLTAGQRQQLIALHLISAAEPLILNWLQHNTGVSRTTVLKDLDLVEEWAAAFGLTLVRKPNYGIEVNGPELARRQTLAALMWGDTPFEDQLTSMSHASGLTFALAGNTAPPIVPRTTRLLNNWDIQYAFEWVAFAEAQLGGRFTDNAVLHLALTLAIQAQRARTGHTVACPADTLAWLQQQKVWTVARDVTQTIWAASPASIPPTETAVIAMQLLATVRDHMWPGDLEIDPTLTDLIDVLMAEVAMAFATPGLRQDTALRDGLVAHIIPALMRQRFGLWAPLPLIDEQLPDRYQQEYTIARELTVTVAERTGVTLPDAEIGTLALLLRAAFIRESASRPKRVYIICPSGMATAQLLVARLKARFPSLDIAGVLSLRELTPERVAQAQLLIATVPVQSPRRGLSVIQVHPLLLPEDVDKITRWLA